VIREDKCEIVNRYLAPPIPLYKLHPFFREHNQEVDLIDANCEDLPHYKILEKMERSYPDMVVCARAEFSLGASTFLEQHNIKSL